MKGDIYHILNRGVEKRKIFSNKKDYMRFVYNLYDFNNIDITIKSYYQRRKQSQLAVCSAVVCSAVAPPNIPQKKELVDILCWCLMPNHIHVLVREKIDKGASEFSRKIIGGYTSYFNKINDRSGVLFQGRTKIIPIKTDKHFLHLPFYIMANPIGLLESNWKENGAQNPLKALEFLKSYKYSSFLDIIGKENFPFIINKKLFFEFFDSNERQFGKEFTDWLNTNDNY